MQIEDSVLYDCVIIGGGIAGLSLSIQLAKMGHRIVLLEKNTYPFHKVCGEYVSMESYDFIRSLGVDLDKMKLPRINQLNVSAHNGYLITSPLEMGGFGISRHCFDYKLAQIASGLGVLIVENCNALKVNTSNDLYCVETTKGCINSKLVVGSFGKLEPPFIERTDRVKTSKYIAVKYHVKLPFPENLIELHNFKDGYCGISKVENQIVCLCYLTTSKNLNECNNNIKELEKNVLSQNPHLKKYFSEAEFLYDKPLAISQISFKKKKIYRNGLLMLGDSAGAIAPLCGNGMSIALRSSKIIASQIDLFLKSMLSKSSLIEQYANNWNASFSFRIRSGYYLQMLFGKHWTTLLSLRLLATSPFFFRKLIKLTHGNRF